MKSIEKYNLAIEDGDLLKAAKIAAEIASRKASRWNRTCWLRDSQECLEKAGVLTPDLEKTLRRADVTGNFETLLSLLDSLAGEDGGQ